MIKQTIEFLITESNTLNASLISSSALISSTFLNKYILLSDVYKTKLNYTSTSCLRSLEN